MATFTTGPNGQQIATSSGPMVLGPPPPKIEGGLIAEATNRTLQSQKIAADTAKALGAGQKGSSRKRRKHRGGANLNISLPMLPEGGTMKGVSYENVHKGNIDNLNQLRASGTYDKLINSQPIQLTGGVKKHSRKSKKGHGSRKLRTHRRRSHKLLSRVHRNTRRVSHSRQRKTK